MADLREIVFRSECDADTLQLGADIAMIIRPGDLIALSGDLGAGKSTFARGLIRHILQDETHEISSPSYTLCNVYPTEPGIAHYDLYRLADPDELDELGLDEALDTGCAIIEWPENGFETLPKNSVLVKIREDGENARTFTFSGNDNFLFRIERSLEIRNLLLANDLTDFTRRPLDGDASSRRYEKLCKGNEFPLLLMDAPETSDGPPVKNGKPYSQIAHLAENVSAFVAIDKLLLDADLTAPSIPVADLEAGLLVVENLGAEKIIDENRAPIPERYQAAIELLARMHQFSFPSQVKLSNSTSYKVPSYDHDAMIIEVELLLEWYLPNADKEQLSTDTKQEFYDIWAGLIEIIGQQEQSLVLRDYHSPNIIWRGEQTGVGRTGVIDFQDAVMGPAAYDVASLSQDARIDVPAELEASLVDHYISLRCSANTDFDESGFRTAYAIMAAQRATKVLGIFRRLDQRDGKPQYLAHIPRIEAYLKRSLAHPVLADYRQWLYSVIDL